MKVILKKGRETIASLKHHWIFSGAIEQFPEDFENGSILPFFDAENTLLGHAYFNKNTSLSGRIISFGNIPFEEALIQNLQNAFTLREQLICGKSYRVVHAEADHLPGLIVDRYTDYLVVQIGTLGMEKLKPFLIKQLCKLFPVKGIYEKSVSSSRKQERLKPFEGVLYGDVPDIVEIEENLFKFLVPIKTGQKTGFFLDQREMRKLVGELSVKNVLNTFSYTGGFTVPALANGASHIDAVDTSIDAHEIAKQNIHLNHLPLEKCTFHTQDALEFLSQQTALDYDLVILDPPAFAKKKEDIDHALRGYKNLNYQVLSKIKPRSLLLTFSCSYYVDDTMFRKMLFQAAKKAERKVKILRAHTQSFDHPTNIFHRETDYLKGCLLYID